MQGFLGNFYRSAPFTANCSASYAVRPDLCDADTFSYIGGETIF